MKASVIVAMTSELKALERAGVQDVHLAGIGKAQAARTTTELILNHRPDCIISSGCAGGLQPGMGTFDLVLGLRTAFYDVWCGSGNEPGQVQGLPRFFDADPRLVQTAESLTYAGKVHRGLICTGDRFVTEQSEVRQILQTYPEAMACDMESAAIALVCRHYGVPFLSFRLVSDVPGSQLQRLASYDGFWDRMSDNSFAVVIDLLERISGI